jgi:hypothetical protein
MRFLIFVVTLLLLVSAQEVPEGYVAKEAIEKLFKATQGGEIYIDELPPIFLEKEVSAPKGFVLLGGTQQDFSMGTNHSSPFKVTSSLAVGRTSMPS